MSYAVVFLMEKREETIAEDAGDRFRTEAGIGLRFAHHVDDGLVHGYTAASHEGTSCFTWVRSIRAKQPSDESSALEARQRAWLERSRVDTA